MSTVNINAMSGIARNAEYLPDVEALVYGEQTWSYRELVADSRSWAQVLRHHGVGPGDRVAYLGHNSALFLLAMNATWWVGGVYVPVNFRLAPQEVATVLQKSTPTVLVVEPSHLAVLRLIDALDEGLRVIVMDEDPQVPLSEELPPGWMTASAARADAQDGDAGEIAVADDDLLAMLMFTSGTTGEPKGVELTHGNLWWNGVNVDSLVDTRRGDTNLAVAPLFHIGGLNALTVRSMARGGRTVVQRMFHPSHVLRAIAEYRVNQMFMVPAMLSALHQHEDFAHTDISSVRALICAGAPVPEVLIDQYAQKDVRVEQAWGLTETAPFATYLPSELTHAKAGSCGMPMPYSEVKVMDPGTLEEVSEPGVTGELWTRGPNVTRGYWENPEATAASFHDGWFRSGDLGHRDEDGYFYIVDRLKDMIISGGENVYPAEVERALAAYPGLVDVAVVGVPDERWGESVVAVMTCKDGVEPTTEEVRAFAETRLARYKLPKDVVVVPEVPRNGSGKLIKHEIRVIAAERRSR